MIKIRIICDTLRYKLKQCIIFLGDFQIFISVQLGPTYTDIGNYTLSPLRIQAIHPYTILILPVHYIHFLNTSNSLKNK